jgi:carboxyl-terminal processing protease
LTKEYDDFKNWVAKNKFQFEGKGDLALKTFTKAIEEQGIGQNLTTSLTQLKQQLEDQKADDLDQYKSIIIEELEKEIAKRYYLDKGEIEADFDDDKDIQKAIELLNNQALYTKILSGN